MDAQQIASQVAALKTADLIAFWNAHNPEKLIKKFSDRATAEKRCAALAAQILASQSEAAKANKANGKPNGAAAKAETKAEREAREDAEKAAEAGEVWAGKKEKGAPGANATSDKPRRAKKPKVVDTRTAAQKVADATAKRKASWRDPEIYAARIKKDGVTVTVDGETYEFSSLMKAFEEFGLPTGRLCRFRLTLKANQTAEFTFGNNTFDFAISESEPVGE